MKRNFVLASVVFDVIALAACRTRPMVEARSQSAQVLQDETLDPKFEFPWIPSCDPNHYRKNDCSEAQKLSTQELLLKEQQQIAEVRAVISGFVRKQAENRASWLDEYAALKAEFDGKQAPAATRIAANKKYQRYLALGRLYDDLPVREKQTFATRDVHRKSHGCLAATFKVKDKLDDGLQKGIFEPGKSYDAVVRYSNGNPKAMPDFAPDARGMAVKILPSGILHRSTDPQARVPKWLGSSFGSEPLNPTELNKKGLLDIVTINFPVFFVSDPKIYAAVNASFLHVTQSEDAFLENTISDFKSVFLEGMSPWERTLALQVNGSIIMNPLFENYWSMAPSRLGNAEDPQRTAIKYIWKPCKVDEKNHPDWQDLKTYAYPLKGLWERQWQKIPDPVKKNRNHLRHMIAESLAVDGSAPLAGTDEGVCFNLLVQRFVDEGSRPLSTPIEDATSVWLESEAQREEFLRKESLPEFVARDLQKKKVVAPEEVGTLTIHRLPNEELFVDDEGLKSTRNQPYCEDLSFNPWNNVPPAHKPLGIVQRMKREVYSGSRNTRFEINGVRNDFN